MFNKAILMGRLTATPELKNTPNGVAVTTFTLAVERSRGKEKKTDFIDCVAWRGTAEFVSKWFSKGRMLGIVGEINTRKYTDKEGNNRTAFEVVADEAFFTGEKTALVDVTAPAEEYVPEFDDSDDQPF